MVALRAACAALALAACSASAPRHRGAPEPGPTGRASPVDDRANDPPPSPCGELDWARCLGRAHTLVADDDPDRQTEGVVLLRALCIEGDARRCFEVDVPDDARCAGHGFVESCSALEQLYRAGTATCPFDTACAENLRRMVCTARGDDTCAR